MQFRDGPIKAKESARWPQNDLFRMELEKLIDRRHKLVRLSEVIEWDSIASEFGTLYLDRKGRPGSHICHYRAWWSKSRHVSLASHRSTLAARFPSLECAEPTADLSHGRLSTKSSTVYFLAPLTPQIPQKNHSGQHFWPNLFLGRWLKGLSW